MGFWNKSHSNEIPSSKNTSNWIEQWRLRTCRRSPSNKFVWLLGFFFVRSFFLSFNPRFYWINPKIQSFIPKGPRKMCSTNVVFPPVFYLFYFLILVTIVSLKKILSDAIVTFRALYIYTSFPVFHSSSTRPFSKLLLFSPTEGRYFQWAPLLTSSVILIPF